MLMQRRKLGETYGGKVMDSPGAMNPPPPQGAAGAGGPMGRRRLGGGDMPQGAPIEPPADIANPAGPPQDPAAAISPANVNSYLGAGQPEQPMMGAPDIQALVQMLMGMQQPQGPGTMPNR